MAEYRIGLVDNNELVRSGRAMIFNSQLDMRVVFEESDPAVAIERAPDYLVDILVVGSNQHHFRGGDFIRNLSNAMRVAGNECAILTYGAFSSPRYRFDSLRNGAKDYIGLDVDGGELLALTRKVVKRDYVVEPMALRSLVVEFGAISAAVQLEVQLSELDSVQTAIVEEFLKGNSDLAISKLFDVARTRVTQLLNSLVVAAGFTSRNQLAMSLLSGVS